MSDPRGLFRLTAGGKEYRLWLGMSVIADLQEEFGTECLVALDPPADDNGAWVPDLRVINRLFLLALQRYHPDADRYVADEIMSEHLDKARDLIAAAFPAPAEDVAARGNRKARRAST